jgi:hypothetical protein
MMKMKSERPLLIDGEAKTEFETTQHHGKELIAAGLAVQVDSDANSSMEEKNNGEAAPKMADAPENKARKTKQAEA